MKNKNVFLSSLFCLTLLNGCSSQPDVDDVKNGIIETWKPCQSVVKPMEFKKLNGLDNGRTYQLDINYQLLITADIPAAKAFGAESLGAACLAGGANAFEVEGLMKAFHGIVQENMFVLKNTNIIQNNIIKSGQTLDVTTSYEMIKSEKGWVIQ